MRNVRIGIHLLFFIQNRHATQGGFRSFTIQSYAIVVAGQSVGQCDAIDQHLAGSGLFHMQRSKTGCRGTALLQIVVVKDGSLFRKDLDHLCCQKLDIIYAMITHQQMCFSTLLHNHQDTTVGHQIDIATEDIDQLDRTFHMDSLRHIQHKTVLGQKRIEGNQSILSGSCSLGIIAGGNLRMLTCEVLQSSGIDTLWQMRFRQLLVEKGVVDHEIE